MRIAGPINAEEMYELEHVFTLHDMRRQWRHLRRCVEDEG